MLSKKIIAITSLGGLITAVSLLIAWTTPGHDPNPHAANIKKAVAKSLPLLQASGHKFIAAVNDRCVSCHNNLLTSVLEEKMMQKGMPATDEFRVERRQTTVAFLRATNLNTPDLFITAKFIAPYALIGFHADKGEPDPFTDIAVDFILYQQRPDGTFKVEAGRPPHETGEAHLAAVSILAIQLYGSPAKKTRIQQAIDRTRQWLIDYQAGNQQELAFQLLGLQYTGATPEERKKIATRLIALQNNDGSWSQLPSMRGDAYATAEALYALSESGTAKPTEECIQKSVGWLLKTQDPSGAWIVETRAYPVQPFFNADFPPYDENQFISAAATNWACLALLSTLPDDPKAAIPASTP